MIGTKHPNIYTQNKVNIRQVAGGKKRKKVGKKLEER